MLRVDRRFLNVERVGAVLLAALASLLLLATDGWASSQPRIRDIQIDPQVLTLAPGETKNLTAFAVYDDGSTKDVTTEVIFESRDDQVVQITGRTAKAIGAGETTIRASHPPSGEDASNPAEVTVLLITALAIQPASSTVQVGSTVQLHALATLEDGRTDI